MTGTYSGNKIYNNIIIGSDNHVNDGDRSAITMQSGSQGTLAGVEIYNNTIYGKYGTRALYFDDCSNIKVKNNIVASEFVITYLDSSCESGFESDYNLFQAVGSPSYSFTDRDSFYGDFSDWQALGYDANSNETDPLFTNASGLLNQDSDFNISETSPAKDNGTTIALVTGDYLDTSRPQGSGYDIGAFEYIAEVADTTPPNLSNPSPTEDFPSSITSVDIALDTDENATCKYSTTPGVDYDSMTNTFNTTGGTFHSTNVSGLSAGNYTYYIRCSDDLNNKNESDFSIEFEIVNSVPLYRFWSDTYLHHFYTTADPQLIIDKYPSEIWRYDKVGFYAISN